MGNWKQNKKEGKGVYYYANADKEEGTWKNNGKSGTFKFTKAADGTVKTREYMET